MHLDDTTDTLGLARKRIQHVVAFLQGPGVDASKRQCAVAIIHNLESEGAQRLQRVYFGEFTGRLPFEVHFRLRLDLCRIGQIVNYCIKNVLYPFVFKGRATVSREEFQRNSALANAGLEIVNRRLVALKILLEQVVVLLESRLNEFLAPFLDSVQHVCGHVSNLIRLRIGWIAPDPGLARQHVLVVNAEDGLDEISIGAATQVAELKNGEVSVYSIQPEDFGMQRADLETIRAKDAADSLDIIRRVFSNEAGPAKDIVSLNAGAAIYVSGLADSLVSGVEKAQEVIASGEVANKLEELISATNR